MSTFKSNNKLHINYMYLLMLFISCYSLVRCFFETDLSDESYYVSEAITVLSGNTPLAYNTSLTSGMSFLILPILFIVRIFNPEFTGIVLILRICFTLFRFLLIFCISKLLYPDSMKDSCFLWIMVMIPYSAAINNQWSYNSISVWLLITSGALLCYSLDTKHPHSLLFCFLSGVLSCLCFFAHAFMAVSILTQIVLLLIYVRKENGVYRFLLYSIGGLTQALLVFIGIMISGGFSNICSGIETLINHPFEQSGSWKTQVKLCLQYFSKSLLMYFILFVLSVITVIVISKIKKKNTLIKHMLFEVAMLTLALTCISHFFINCKKVEWHFAGLIFLLTFAICFFIKDCKSSMLFLGLPIIVFTAGEILFSYTNGPTTRFQFFIPLIIPILYMADNISNKTLIRISAFSACSLVLLGSLRVYRDDELINLRYRVSDGVYKGLYTTEQRSQDLPEIERYIKTNTGKGVSVSFRDNVPFAYMMSNGTMCELSTWDCLQYTRGCNNPSNLYRYYMRKKSIPETIIYIDFGTDSKLSIDDTNYKYNSFINTYYTLTDKQTLNKTFFDVRKYELNSSITYDDIDFESMLDE